MTMGDAKRIRALRERTGKSSEEVAVLAGLQSMEYFDLELHDDELSSVPSLATVKRLAMALGVHTSALFLDAGAGAQRVSYVDLAARVRTIMASGTSQQELEEQVGWHLGDFLAGEEKALSHYTAEFLKSLCDRVGVAWIEALP